MKYVLLLLMLAYTSSALPQQKTENVRLALSFGTHNTGISASYRISHDIDLIAGCNLIRYFNFGFNGRVRYYFQRHDIADSLRKGAFFLGGGIEYMTRCHFAKEDSRKFVNTYYIPCNRYLIAELGYKLHRLDASINVFYYWSLRKHYAASLASGSDIEGEVNRINRFIDGGWGGGISGYIALRRVKKKKIDQRSSRRKVSPIFTPFSVFSNVQHSFTGSCSSISTYPPAAASSQKERFSFNVVRGNIS